MREKLNVERLKTMHETSPNKDQDSQSITLSTPPPYGLKPQSSIGRNLEGLGEVMLGKGWFGAGYVRLGPSSTTAHSRYNEAWSIGPCSINASTYWGFGILKLQHINASFDSSPYWSFDILRLWHIEASTYWCFFWFFTILKLRHVEASTFWCFETLRRRHMYYLRPTFILPTYTQLEYWVLVKLNQRPPGGG